MGLVDELRREQPGGERQHRQAMPTAAIDGRLQERKTSRALLQCVSMPFSCRRLISRDRQGGERADEGEPKSAASEARHSARRTTAHGGTHQRIDQPEKGEVRGLVPEGVASLREGIW